MKIVVATPLYPPEIAEPAPYVKELAKRLVGRHEVTVVAYGRLPEPVEGVRIIAVDKGRPLPVRLVAFAIALYRAARAADLVYTVNGASAELPAALIARLTGRPLLLALADEHARMRAERSMVLRLIGRATARSARSVVREMPFARPEIFPLEPRPEEALADYEKSWQLHLLTLAPLFDHA